MKRSQINRAIRDMEALAQQYRFALPPFCGWTRRDWLEKNSACDEIRDNMLGWDVTDYGQGDFTAVGLTLITLRNGSVSDARYQKSYAEKLIMSYEEQVCPMHFHFGKMEDIINRGGGRLMIRLYNAAEDGTFADADVALVSDGVRSALPAGSVVTLAPGQSITISPGLYHEWRAEKGGGPVLIGEVSRTNDDKADNRFYRPLQRFSTVEEDEAPYRLLCNEYPPAVNA